MKVFLLIAILIVGAWLFCIRPGRRFLRQSMPFMGRTFANRGLYASDQHIPENSLPAFLSAVQAGYGIKLEVRLTKDQQAVVFHDDTLARACGVEARFDALTYEELTTLSLFDTDHRIPLLSDVLAIIAGRVPIIVELKADDDWEALCGITWEILKTYQGDYCVGSFHPLPIRWFYKNAPKALRGQWSMSCRSTRQPLPWCKAFINSQLLGNFFTHAQFLACPIDANGPSVRACRWLGGLRVSWTAHAEDDWAYLMRISDCIIFEHCRPATHYVRNDPAAPLHVELEPLLNKHPAEHVSASTPKG